MRAISLRTSLALMLAAATLLSFTVVATLILVVRLPQVEQRAREQAQSMALESNRLLDNYMESVEQQIEPLVHALRSRRTAAEVQLLLDAIVGIGTTFDSLVLVGPDGRVEGYGLPRSRVVVAGFSMRGLDLSANRLYREQKARQKDGNTRPLWSDSYLSVLSGQMTVGVAIPAGGRMVIGELSQARLLKLMNSIGYTDEAVVLVVDRTGKLLASSAVRPLSVSDFGGYASFKALVQRQSLPLYEEVNGQRQLVGGVVSPKLGWVIAAAMPAGWALYNYRLTVLIIVAGYIGSLLISLVLAPLWARRLTQPFRALAGQAHRIARGDPPAPAEQVGQIAEFRQLATDLDGMGQAIQAREAAMQRSEARLKATLESTPSVAIQWFDVHGRVLYWNRASTELYGYTAEEAVGCLLTENSLMYRDVHEGQAFVALLVEMERSGQPTSSAEYDLRHKDGRTVTVLATTFPLPGGDGDTVFVCMDVDITQRKQAEEALRTHEVKLDAIFNASPAPMSVSDLRKDYSLVGVNRAWEQLFARPRDTVLGRNGTEIGYWVDAEDRARFVALVETQGHVHDFEAWCLDGQGRAILCQISAQITEIGAERLLLMMTVTSPTVGASNASCSSSTPNSSSVSIRAPRSCACPTSGWRAPCTTCAWPRPSWSRPRSSPPWAIWWPASRMSSTRPSATGSWRCPHWMSGSRPSAASPARRCVIPTWSVLSNRWTRPVPSASATCSARPPWSRASSRWRWTRPARSGDVSNCWRWWTRCC